MRQDFHFWIYKSKHFLYQKHPLPKQSLLLSHSCLSLFVPCHLAIVF